MAATTGGRRSPGTTARGNISVTSINCDGPNIPQSSLVGSTLITNNGSTTLSSTSAITSSATPSSSASSLTTTASLTNGTQFYENCGVRISVPKMEESDESESELSNIENSIDVGLRDNRNKDVPRPMSWEGELSETEDNNMVVENLNNDDSQQSSSMPATSSSSTTSSIIFQQKLINPVINNQNDKITLNDNKNNIIITKDNIKPEIIDSNIIISGQQYSGTTLNKKFQHTDFINVKNEIIQQQQTDTNVINSPLLARSKTAMLPANPSPDSAIHSIYTHSSPSQSPLTSRHTPYTPSLSRNNSDASHSSCYSYSSEFSPTHSPIQGRHYLYGGPTTLNNSTNTTTTSSTSHHQILYRPMLDGGTEQNNQTNKFQQTKEEGLLESNETLPSAGISRQQLINSPCPICGDKISGFHYGIFSCESCKGFFKRTVQNRKNYVCLRGAGCPVTIATRKKCPACRFEKCLNKGMKLEAIREDRTRGGRSTYQCSYTLPGSMLSPSINSETSYMYFNNQRSQHNNGVKMESMDNNYTTTFNNIKLEIPSLLQEIMDVEHLWHYNEAELSRLNQPPPLNQSSSVATNPLLASAGLSQNEANPDLIANLCNVADHRLYKIVKWCKSLPLFKNISIDDQICLLINSWCELLLFSCCFRSMSSPGEIRISLGKSITLQQAKSSGLQACIERMLNLTEHLRRLKVDQYEYAAMKVIVLLQSDTSELKEPEKVRTSQEKALQALQAYTLSHYPETPAKFGELLLRIPELQRTCQVGKEMLIIKSKEGEEFNLLMELLRGEH